MATICFALLKFRLLLVFVRFIQISGGHYFFGWAFGVDISWQNCVGETSRELEQQIYSPGVWRKLRSGWPRLACYTVKNRAL